MADRRSLIKGLGVAALFVGVTIALSVLPVELWLAEARLSVAQRPIAGVTLFLVGFVIGTVMLVPGSLLFMTGGFLFGWVFGAIWVSLGTLCGPVLAAAASRTLFREALEHRFASQPTFKALDRALEEKDMLIVVLTRLSLLIPYNVLNVMYGLTGISLPRLAGATWFGMLPAVVLYTYLGSLVQNAGGLLAGDGEQGIAGNIVLLTGLATLVLVSWLIHRTATRALKAELANNSEETNAGMENHVGL